MVRKPRFVVILVSLMGSLLCCSSWAFADGLVIHGTSTLTLNDATLDLSCRDLTVEDSGTLDLGSGTVRRLGTLAVIDSGVVIWDMGRVYYCMMPSWVPLLLLLDDDDK